MPTHGALSKAGKVRSLSASKEGRAKPKSKPNPRVQNKRKYNNRVILRRGIGQYNPGRRRYKGRHRR
jgi:ribosomal protein S30